MDSPPYHYYHHYDPTIITTHTLLKPQTYQHPTSIKTHISPAPTYPNSIDSNSLHYLIRQVDYVTEQLRHSHKACLHSISSFASQISTLNNSLTSPNFTHQQQPFITSTTVFNHNFNQHSHDPFPPPKSTPFNHHNFPYNTTTHFNNQPVNPQAFVSPSISISTVTPIVFTPPQLEICTHSYKPPATSKIPLYNSNHVTTEIDTAKKLVPDLPIHSDPVFAAKDFNNEAPSNLVLDSITTFSTVTDERSRDDVVTVKGHKEGIRQVPPSIFQSSCDSNRVESLTIQSIVEVPIGFVPAKHHFTVVTRKDSNTLFGPTKQQVLNHELSVNNFERYFDFHVGCTFNFDPGGDKASAAAANYGGNRCIFFPLLLPWDRGKIGSYNFLFPVKGAALGATSGRWVPWSSMKMTASVTTTPAKHAREEETPRVIWELKSLKFFNDLMGSSYLAQDAFSYLARDAKKKRRIGV